MMLHERRSQIADKVKHERMLKVSDLMREYDVSIETIRRDLEYLEKKGVLQRVYGGAVLHGLYSEEPAYAHREIVNYEEKKAIGRAAAELIKDGDTVFVEVGTTTREVAYHLKKKSGLTIITNATQIAQEMTEAPDCRVILLGGEMRPGELAVSGAMAIKNIENFYAGKALVGIGGISLENGITDYHMEEAQVRREMIARANTVIAVADHSKFGVTAVNYIGPADCVDTLVTDWGLPAKLVAAYKAADIQVIVAGKTE